MSFENEWTKEIERLTEENKKVTKSVSDTVCKDCRGVGCDECWEFKQIKED